MDNNKKENKPKVYLAILNITSWAGYSIGAEHLYGKLILNELKEVTEETVDDWSINGLGQEIEVKRPLTIELAKTLDEKDGFNSNQRALRHDKNASTYRFDTFEQVIKEGVKLWKNLDIDCPFINLYEGNKYKTTKHVNEHSETFVLKYGEDYKVNHDK